MLEKEQKMCIELCFVLFSSDVFLMHSVPYLITSTKRMYEVLVHGTQAFITFVLLSSPTVPAMIATRKQ